MTDGGISEKIVQSTLLLAVGRVAMALTLPLLLMGIGYLSALSATVASHTNEIGLIKQEQQTTTKRLDGYDKKQDELLVSMQSLIVKTAESGKDLSYLREWVERLQQQGRLP